MRRSNLMWCAVKNVWVNNMNQEPKFIIKKCKVSGQFYMTLTAKNGVEMVCGTMFRSVSGVLNQIESVRRNAPIACIEDQADISDDFTKKCIQQSNQSVGYNVGSEE